MDSGNLGSADFRKLLSNYPEVDQIQGNQRKYNLKSCVRMKRFCPLTFYLNKFRLPLPRSGEESGREGVGGNGKSLSVSLYQRERRLQEGIITRIHQGTNYENFQSRTTFISNCDLRPF
jgi:hypothetical protein